MKNRTTFETIKVENDLDAVIAKIKKSIETHFDEIALEQDKAKSIPPVQSTNNGSSSILIPLACAAAGVGVGFFLGKIMKTNE